MSERMMTQLLLPQERNATTISMLRDHFRQCDGLIGPSPVALLTCRNQ